MNRIENLDQRGRIPSFSPNPSGRGPESATLVILNPNAAEESL